MILTSEIYLTKSKVTPEEWLELINTISDYNGYLKRWRIIIVNENNHLRYFVKTRCSLPASIKDLSCFLLKEAEDIKEPEPKYSSFSFPRLEDNIIDLINFCEVRNKGTLEYLDIRFSKSLDGKIKSKVKYYINKNGIVKRCIVPLSIPTNILAVDFAGNSRYFYKKCPKYLDINKILHLLNSDSSNALLSVDTFPYLQGKFYLNQNSFCFDKHSIIMGSSGCGKSKFISLLVNNIFKNERLRQQYKVVVIDPHAALENDIGGIGKVIDFKDKLDSIDLFINNTEDIVASTELLIDLFKALIADQYNSKLERVLRHSIHVLLADKSFNFKSLRKLLLDLEYRNDLIKKVKNNVPVSVVDFFLVDFNDLRTKSYSETISPIISFIDEMEMIPVFNSTDISTSLSDTIKDNFLTLFSLDRTKLGDKVTKTIAGLIMQQLLTIIQMNEIDQHIIFIIDEVAVIENPILSKYLSEARKYNLSLILAGQYFNQISEELKSSIFANVVNYYIFRVSKLDANILADSFNMKIPTDDSRETKVKLLSELNNRECIVRVSSNDVLLPAFKGVTLNYTSIPRIKRESIKESNNLEENDNKSTKTKFSLYSNVSLKDIMISTSTNRRGVRKNGR